MNAYLFRREMRCRFDALKRNVAFGLAISLLLLGYGFYQYFFVIGVKDNLWAAVGYLGVLTLVSTLAAPWIWHTPERALSGLVKRIGEPLFGALLAVAYIVLVWPVGILFRRIKGLDPIYAWQSDRPHYMEGWRDKEVVVQAGVGARKSDSTVLRAYYVVRFFVERGHYAFVPLLVLLLALGLTLFFIKTSVLAPFIYTLF